MRALRRVSAWAFPRPSAMASAKLAKSTVNQSHIDICSGKPTGSPRIGAKISSTVVTTAPTNVTKITGFLAR